MLGSRVNNDNRANVAVRSWTLTVSCERRRGLLMWVGGILLVINLIVFHKPMGDVMVTIYSLYRNRYIPPGFENWGSVVEKYLRNVIIFCYSSTQTKFSLVLCINIAASCFFSQHWGRVRAYGRRRGHVQSVPHPSQEPEDPGCRRGDHPPESRHKAWDLVGSDHQLLDQRFMVSDLQRRRGV